jgi:hypothetical protein
MTENVSPAASRPTSQRRHDHAAGMDLVMFSLLAEEVV